MNRTAQLLALICASLLVTGGLGVATHRSARPLASHSTSSYGHLRRSNTARPPVTAMAPVTLPATTTTAPAGPAGPTSSDLDADLVTPTDTGGYFHPDEAAADSLTGHAICLAPLSPSPAQDGRAYEALLGPDTHSLPTIVEELASYPAGRVDAVYRSAAAALTSCRSFAFQFGGTEVSAVLTPDDIAPVGDADQAWTGTFAYAGVTLHLEVGVARAGQVLVGLLYVDSVPPSDPIMGSFASDLSLAIGKLA